MIQRTQSLYFFGIFLIAFTMIAANFKISEGVSTLGGIESNFELTFQKTSHLTNPVKDHQNTLLVLDIAISGLLAITTLFLFKRLRLQRQLAKLNFLLIFLMIALLIHENYQATAAFTHISNTHFSVFNTLPFLMIFLNFMAAKGIKKDIDLLASTDRLR